jgi:hypothetical protein
MDKSQDAEDAENTEERKRRERAQAVYGDTDMNPNAGDQESAHHAEPDEHV